jgi:hypothetical protein
MTAQGLNGLPFSRASYDTAGRKLIVGQGAATAEARRDESAQARSISDLAEQEGVSDAYVCRLLPQICLAPDIVEAILDGRQPKGLKLAGMLGNGPPAWAEQRLNWGFCSAFGGGSPRENGRAAAGKKASALQTAPSDSAEPLATFAGLSLKLV